MTKKTKTAAGSLLKTDGSSEVIVPANPKKGYSLKELQAFVGGYIEVVGLEARSGEIMVVNEEGLLQGLPVNVQASDIAMQRIVGNVVIIPRKDLK